MQDRPLEGIRVVDYSHFLAGPFVSRNLAALGAGLVEGREVTAYPGILDGQADIRLSSAAVVRDGTFITSRGPGTALDFALTLIETLCGRETRDTVEAALQRS